MLPYKHTRDVNSEDRHERYSKWRNIAPKDDKRRPRRVHLKSTSIVECYNALSTKNKVSRTPLILLYLCKYLLDNADCSNVYTLQFAIRTRSEKDWGHLEADRSNHASQHIPKRRLLYL